MQKMDISWVNLVTGSRLRNLSGRLAGKVRWTVEQCDVCLFFFWRPGVFFLVTHLYSQLWSPLKTFNAPKRNPGFVLDLLGTQTGPDFRVMIPPDPPRFSFPGPEATRDTATAAEFSRAQDWSYWSLGPLSWLHGFFMELQWSHSRFCDVKNV